MVAIWEADNYWASLPLGDGSIAAGLSTILMRSDSGPPEGIQWLKFPKPYPFRTEEEEIGVAL